MSVLRQLADHSDMNDYLWHLAYTAWTPELGPHSPQLRWRRAVRTVIAEAADARRLYPTGSSTRGTAIDGFSDVDHFVVMPGEPPTDADDAMHALHAAVSRILGRANVSLVDAPSVTLVDPYDDGLLDFVPAYRHAQPGFLIYDAGESGYLATDPLAHVAYVHSLGTYVRTLVRLFKSWKYAHCNKISSIYLEMFCASRAAPHATGDLLHDLIETFECLHISKLQPPKDPCSQDGRLLHAGSNDTADLAELRRKVEAALQEARRIDWAVRSGAPVQGETYAAALLIAPGLPVL